MSESGPSANRPLQRRHPRLSGTFLIEESVNAPRYMVNLSYALHMSQSRNRDTRSVETFTIIQMRPPAGGQVPKSNMHLDQET